MLLRLIIFDLDGTLVDTVQDITDALNYGLKPYGIKSLTVRDTVEMVGEGISRLIEKILSVEKKHLKEDIIKRFLEYYSEHLADSSREYPYVKETLEKLKYLKKAVISNKGENLSRRLLEKLGIAQYFNLIIGSDTTGEKKPSPMPVLYAVSKLSVSPQESMIVGDSNYDIEAGKKAGIRTVAVTYGYRAKEFLIGADYLISDLKELVSLITEIEEA